MQSSVMQCRHLLKLSDSILAGLDDSHLSIEPQSGTKTAGWLIGHLAVTGDFARRLCGHTPPLCPKEWRAKFNPGTQPSSEQGDYPPFEELRSAFRTVYEDLCDAAMAVDQTKLSIENPYEPGRASFPTAADFVHWMLSGHLAYHLGQLGAWRTAAGLGRFTGTHSVAV